MMRASLEELERRLGHTFADKELLLRALTHKSLLADVHPDCVEPETAVRDNEQLEFLGDAVLGFLASEFVLQLCPSYPEGKLSKLKAHLVSAAHLLSTAQAIDLGEYLLLGRGEEMSGGRGKKALLANAVEALIAALYLDAGPVEGLEVCRRFLERYVWNGIRVEQLGEAEVPVDAKSALQELAQSLKLPVPRYVIVHETGPEHAKTFVVEARVGKEFTAQSDGTSKKAAGQKAAELLLQHLQSLQSQ